MSLRYKGAVISATPPTTTGGNSGTAPGAWTLQQQLQAQGAGNWPNQPVYYIEDVFSTWLYTGNGSTQTITNGIDLAGKGGLVWTKVRSTTYSHFLADTIRGAGSVLSTNNTNAADTGGNLYSGFNTNGYGVTTSYGSGTNGNGATFASWTFRKQPKFFDVVTYTGNGANRTIAHSLGSAPGCVIVKRLDDVGNWAVWHRSGTQSNVYAAILNQTGGYADQGLPAFWGATGGTPDMNASTFSIGTSSNVNASGGTYVAYLFAHNAGGFGLTGTDNVISCGSYTGNGSANGPIVTLNYEPQWIIIKKIDSSGGAWWMADTMRGFDNTSDQFLWANSTTNEIPKTNYVKPTATGFQIVNTDFDVNEAGANYIYIAIRRGPMKTPTSGTSVFSPSVRASGTGAAVSTTGVGFPPDLLISSERTTGVLFTKGWHDRLRGNVILRSDVTNNEAADSTGVTAYGQDGFSFGTDGGFATVNYSGSNYVYEAFRRAPGFFDEVCYTGTGSATTFNHNLGVAPELMIIKDRTVGEDWTIYSQTLATNQALKFTTAAREQLANYWNTTRPTSSVFSVGDYAGVNSSGDKYVAYLFASVAGVSKVGSYSGTGATQTIDCGFTGGARFVLIKRTDSTGSWWVWDTVRGMVAGSDPRLALNTSAAEVNADWVYTNASGFQIVTTDATVNASGGSYIYLAIA